MRGGDYQFMKKGRIVHGHGTGSRSEEEKVSHGACGATPALAGRGRQGRRFWRAE
jgi:hypothetical protein